MPAWAEQLADAFWHRAGGPPDPPRDLEPVIPRTADVFVASLANLTLTSAQAWIHRRGIAIPLAGSDRAVKGLVVAFRGRGVIFVEEALPPDERRVILAHEFAHYLLEYVRPRERVLRRIGPQVLPVLDGEASEPPAEWAALLAGVPLGVHTHFLSREFDPGDRVGRSERAANELALELLAPRRLLAMSEASIDDVARKLVDRYGLPSSWASGYAGAIVASNARRQSFSERLGL